VQSDAPLVRPVLRLAAVPWRYFKWRAIRRALSDPGVLGSFAEKRPLPPGFGNFLDERMVEYPAVLSRLAGMSPSRILDAGSALNFETILDHPSIAGHHLTIMTLAHEADCFYERNHDYVFGDLRRTFFRDDTFDAVVSISTLEHVGFDTSLYGVESASPQPRPDDYLLAVDELHRVLKPGGKCMITVPCGRRAFHGFLQIFDDGELERLIDRFRPRSAEVVFYRHHPAGWALCEGFDEVRDAGYSSYLVEGRLAVTRPGAEAIAVMDLEK
jgi:SAM-dependent methyltransferase